VIVQVDNDDRLLSAANSNPVTSVSLGNGKHKSDKVRASKDAQFIPKPEDSETTAFLLPVDMVFNSGLSLVCSEGKLLRYEQFQFHQDQLPETY
jgi:hypothetical protein